MSDLLTSQSPHLRLLAFARDQSGAINVDWVVLTASIVGIGLAVMAGISVGLDGESQNISGALGAITID